LPSAFPDRQARQGAARAKRAAPCERHRKPARGPARLGLLAFVAAALVLAGCGSAKNTSGAATATTKTTAGLHNAIPVPPSTELTKGESVKVTAERLNSVGWQASCTGKGKRVNAEAVRGQLTGSGQISGFRGGPSIWVAHNRDGSITVSCR